MPHWTLAAVARRALERETDGAAPLPLPGGALRPGFWCVVRGHAATLAPSQLARPGGDGLRLLPGGVDRVYRVRDGEDPPLLLRYVCGDGTAARPPLLVRLFGLQTAPFCFVHADRCEVLRRDGASVFLTDPEEAVRELDPDELLDAVVARYRFFGRW